MVLESKHLIPLQVAKWIKIALLIDDSEMEELISHLPPFKMYDVQRVTAQHEGIYTPQEFLTSYRTYISLLKEGVIPSVEAFRFVFSAAWSVTEEALYALPTQEGRRLLKASSPVVQSQLNQIRYAPEEKVFRNQVYASDSISWGIQLGFPHVFMDAETSAVGKTKEFPNMSLFAAIQKWVRYSTSPTPFLVNGETINSPIRIGKNCFSWIASHPQLKAQGLIVSANN